MKHYFLILTLFITTVTCYAQITDNQLILPAKIHNETIIKHQSYICSYNINNKTPNYIAWILTPERVNGKVKRSNKFQGDPNIPKPLRIETSDFSGSGYDRGHMCPAADNRHSSQAMNECFYMTNICPQNHELNSRTWNDLEMQCRNWTKKYKKLYIVSGPVYSGNQHKTIGKRKAMRIQVPEAFFKVILIMGKQPKAVGFIMKNTSVTDSYKKYTVSIDEIERKTGIDFFPALPDNIERKVEAMNKITF